MILDTLRNYLPLDINPCWSNYHKRYIRAVNRLGELIGEDKALDWCRQDHYGQGLTFKEKAWRTECHVDLVLDTLYNDDYRAGMASVQ